MSAVEMLDPVVRFRETGEFTQWQAENAQNGSGITADDEGTFVLATQDLIYGPVVGANLAYLREHADPGLALDAARVLCEATITSSIMYAADRGGVRGGLDVHRDEHFQQALLETQTAMANGGTFQFMPPEYGMTRAEGRQQVKFADRLLDPRRTAPAVQKVLAAANYTTYFGKATMADAADMLKTTVEQTINITSPDKMPHLKRGNLVLAEETANIVRNVEKGARVVVVDCGTGTGGTLAPTIAEMNQITDYQNVSVFSVEPNPAYAAGLRDFAPVFMEGIQKINPAFELVTSDTSVEIERNETLSLVETDIVSMIDSLDISSLGGKDVIVFLQNYVWHRLPSKVKLGVIGRLMEKLEQAEEERGEAPSVIFEVIDLAENGSVPVNNRYFNLGNNGPLNPGNPGLKGIFEYYGFKVIKPGEESHRLPRSDPRLATAIVNERANDGHMWIAYHGKEAERLAA